MGETELNVWGLREQARIPPIVLLSACDTHPIDASHASVANGFLNAGALTVLATLLPIAAIESSIFIVRLILRLEAYLPYATREGKCQIQWTSVVSGLQRMMFSTETLRLLLRKKKVTLSEEAHLQVMSNTNMLINSERPDWYEQMLELFAEAMVVPIDELTKLIQEWGQIPESIKYIQLGNPELIFIGSNENLVDENVEQNNDQQ